MEYFEDVLIVIADVAPESVPLGAISLLQFRSMSLLTRRQVTGCQCELGRHRLHSTFYFKLRCKPCFRNPHNLPLPPKKLSASLYHNGAFVVLIWLCGLSTSTKTLTVDLLHPSNDFTSKQHKLKRLVQSPNSYFMDVKCPGMFALDSIMYLDPIAHVPLVSLFFFQAASPSRLSSRTHKQ